MKKLCRKIYWSVKFVWRDLSPTVTCTIPNWTKWDLIKNDLQFIWRA